MLIRNKTPPEYIYHGLYLYFSGLSLRRTSQQLSCFIKRNHVTIWNWIQKYHPQRLSSKSRRISEFIIDETLFKVGLEYVWLWVAIEPENRQILLLSISKERNMFVAERFMSDTDQGLWKSSGFHRWRYMVSAGLPILKTTTSYSFYI